MRNLLFIPLLFGLAACHEHGPYVATVNDDVIRNAAGTPVTEEPPTEPRIALPIPDATTEMPRLDAATQAPRYAAPAEVIVDASTPEAFLASLQAAEAVLQPSDAEDLKIAMMILTDRAQRRFVAHTASTNQQVPKHEVFRRAYGDLDGASVQQVLIKAADHAREYLRYRQSTPTLD